METQSYRNPSAIGGVVLIVLGVLLFASTQGLFDFAWGALWPALLIVAGLALIATAWANNPGPARAGGVTFGTIVLLLGSFFFATTLDLLSWDSQGILWPVYPLIVGLGLLAGYLASGREQRGYLISGLIVAAVGGICLVFTLTDTAAYLKYIWPLFLVAAGVLLLFRPQSGARLGR